VGEQKQVNCPVCYSGGIPSTYVGQYGEELKCPVCRGKRKVSPEVDGAYRLIRGELTPWKAGKLLRKTVPELLPRSWWDRISSALTRLCGKKDPYIIGVRFPNEKKTK